MRPLFTSLILLVTVGCAVQQRPKELSPSARCRQKIQDGSVFAGQSESEFLKRCGPAEASQIGDLRLYHFVILRGYEGLTVIAKDGHLVRAYHWTDYAPPDVYFDTTSDADRAILKERTHFE